MGGKGYLHLFMKGINFNISCIALWTSYNPNVSLFFRLSFRLLLQAGVTVRVTIISQSSGVRQCKYSSWSPYFQNKMFVILVDMKKKKLFVRSGAQRSLKNVLQPEGKRHRNCGKT